MQSVTTPGIPTCAQCALSITVSTKFLQSVKALELGLSLSSEQWEEETSQVRCGCDARRGPGEALPAQTFPSRLSLAAPGAPTRFCFKPVRPLPWSPCTRARTRTHLRPRSHTRTLVAAARSATSCGAPSGARLPGVVVRRRPRPWPCCQTGRGLGLVQPPGQHLLDSFIQVTPELPGIFEAPSLPLPGTRGAANSLVTCSPESYWRALGNLYPAAAVRRREKASKEEEWEEEGKRRGGEGSTKIPGLPVGGSHQEPCVPRGWASS